MKDIQQLIKGVTEPLLLYLIDEIPMYGYQIIKELERRTTGYFKLRGGTIYPMLRRLEEKGLVISRWQQISEHQRRRYYEITDKGRQFLKERLAEWKDFSTAVSTFIEPNLSR
jgi:PadR family transcriptional regulator PadR